MRASWRAQGEIMPQSARTVGWQALSPLLEALPCAVLITDRELRIAHVNPDWERFHDRPAASVVGQHLFQIQPTLQQFHGALDKCLNAGEVLKAGPYRTVLQDGSSRLVRSVTLAWTRATGEAGGLVQVVAEMPASQAAEQQLRIEERLSRAAELAGVFVWELDLVTGTTWAAGARDTFFEGAVGAREARDNIWDTVHPDDRAQAMAQWQKSLADGGRFHAEYRLNRADKLVWVASGAAVVAGTPEQPQRLLGVLQNITERKEAELAAEAGARAKSAFLATVSHEIRTPLNGILGMAQAMAADALSQVQRERLDIIRQSGQALLAILNDVLDLSKVEAGKLELEVIEFSFSDVADGVCSAFAALAQGKGLSFSVDVEQARGVYRGDPTRLRQILYNLLANALKFTDAGGIAVGASLADGALCLEVTDTGIGIAEDKLGTLFDAFAQVDASTTRRYGGSGLGLSICRELVERMGGRIEVASRVGQGSRFAAIVPLPRIGDEAPAAPATPAASPEPFRPMRVLAAEDNEVNRLVLVTLLAQVGIEPFVVENGALAVEAWAHEPWDIILMDVHMPEMDGVTATQRIRAREAAEGRPRTPIVALTANVMAHQVADYLQAGMDDHVPKPIEAAHLFTVMERVLSAGPADQRDRRTA